MRRILLAALISLTTCAPAYAGGPSPDRPPVSGVIRSGPEGVVTPKTITRSDGHTVVVGWQLTYTNRTTLGAPDTESSYVVLPSGESAEIKWHLDRVYNRLCTETTPPPPDDGCGDVITVIQTPPGYIAIPNSKRVEEGSSFVIDIVPEIIG